MQKNENVVRKKLKVEHYVNFELEYLLEWSKSDPQVFMNWVIENGWHRRVCMRGEDLEKFRFMRRWMQNKKKSTIFVEEAQLKLL